jgi:hypothetical protein
VYTHNERVRKQKKRALEPAQGMRKRNWVRLASWSRRIFDESMSFISDRRAFVGFSFGAAAAAGLFKMIVFSFFSFFFLAAFSAFAALRDVMASSAIFDASSIVVDFFRHFGSAAAVSSRAAAPTGMSDGRADFSPETAT